MAIRQEHIVWNEEDVIGQFACLGSIYQGLKSGIVPSDFILNHTKNFYQSMTNLADRQGHFNSVDLLDDDIEKNKYLLHLMDDCLMTNLKVKCDFIVDIAVKRAR